jgi:apolipoprotein N-acyltransferase
VNSARLLTPGGAQRYVKRKPIPGVELGYSVGDSPLVLADNVGIAICKDMDFPQMIRDYGARGVTLMLVPAWDFVKDGRLHARMAVIRGVENGFALARAASDGRLTLSDRYGRIVAEAVTARDRPVSLVGDVGLRSGGTFYARFGDIFGWLIVALATLLVATRLYAIIRKQR